MFSSLRIFLTILCFLLMNGFTFSAFQEESNVIIATDTNWEFLLNNYNQLLVEFYAPWCGHCKRLAPEYDAAATTLQQQHSAMRLAKLDATEEILVGNQLQISGYPTIKYFKDGKLVGDYSGGRTAEEIVEWTTKRVGRPYHIVNTVEQLEALQKSNKYVVLGIFDDITTSNGMYFTNLARADEMHEYHAATSSEIRSHLKLSSEAIVILKNYDSPREDFLLNNGFDGNAVMEFVMNTVTPLITEFSDKVAKSIFEHPVKAHLLIFTDKNKDHHLPTMATYQQVAPSYAGKLLFINVPKTETRLREFFNVEDKETPNMILVDMSNPGTMLKYQFSGDHTVDKIVAFANSYFDGELLPTLKSEKVLPSDKTGPVVVAKGNSFKDIVLSGSDDVLIELYAPWCGHCKKIAPVWEELGAKFQNTPKITIAKMDFTSNEVRIPGLVLKGFPTIYLFKAGAKSNPILYEGDRTVESFTNFLANNANNNPEL